MQKVEVCVVRCRHRHWLTRASSHPCLPRGQRPAEAGPNEFGPLDGRRAAWEPCMEVLLRDARICGGGPSVPREGVWTGTRTRLAKFGRRVWWGAGGEGALD
jgi:hypothetical protein